ncbi:alpha-galactosidase [Marinilactibacillus sp. GCM10026970]|uniref:alpha-galactosidase n=1 Tax=Marinilactibacillus sp. GCM10026970 TaxID=3252642 RepID=UPI00361B58E2
MNIYFDENTSVFHLSNSKISYQISIEEQKYLAHRYFGKNLKQHTFKGDYPVVYRSFGPNPIDAQQAGFSLNNQLLEYSGNDNGDFRESSFQINFSDGSYVSQFRYKGFEILEGKPELKGLPQSFTNSDNEAKTLKITLEDTRNKVQIILIYTIFSDYGIIVRSTVFKNLNHESVFLDKALSMSMDFPHSNFDLIQLSGSWAREREMIRHKINRGVTKVDSKRGTTSHNYQPFVALADPNTTEHKGEVFGVHLVYTGEFVSNIEVDEYNQTRIQMGINPAHFNWEVLSGEEFQTPETVMVYSPDGLNGMSQEYHRFYQNQLIRSKYTKEERPVLINNWEATYFDFKEEKLHALIDEAAVSGVELFVLDDGWFGKRDDDRTSLGDWKVYEEKLPSGLKALSDYVHEKGMKFGLWFEPEMISEDSDLYRSHPDWVLGAKNRQSSVSRNQFVLDFSRPEVRENILEQMRKVLDEVPIDYIKWDFNRNMSEIGSRNSSVRDGEILHRYILGLYDMLETLVTEYPDILWESCSGGGGRYDPGMLYYMPQTWTSDNTDAASRLDIQYGTSLVMPISSMGAHVSATPNHQVGRSISMEMRGHAAMAGNLGYELDLTELSADEKEQVKTQIEWYKKHRKLIQYGEFTRLISPFDKNHKAAWMFTNESKSQAVLFFYQTMARANDSFDQIRLVGLDSDKQYKLSHTGEVYYGDELMYRGVYINHDLHGDYQSKVIEINEVK